jgi:hypothetical protein
MQRQHSHSECSSLFHGLLRAGGRALCRVLLLAALLSGLYRYSEAAEIGVEPDPSGDFVFITVAGELVAGDEKKFTQVALQNDMAIVVLNSPGGSTLAGVEIGKAIRLKGFFTYVPADTVCASACGYIWLAGVQRYMEKTSKIGFHASFVQENGVNRESGVGNALVGAYLNSLGLSQYAIAYISTAPPDSMTWMTLHDAASVGIEVRLGDETESAPAGEKTAKPPDDAVIVVTPLDPPAGQEEGGNRPAVTVPPVDHSQVAMSHIQGADIFGHDLPGMPLKNVSAGQCEEACLSDRRCRAFTYNTRHGVCFLKSDGERVFRNPNAFAGYRIYLESRLRRSTITIAERTDYPGNDYREVRDIGFGECSDRCERDDRCRAFTYLSRKKSCWLKDAVSEPVEMRITISGRKD